MQKLRNVAQPKVPSLLLLLTRDYAQSKPFFFLFWQMLGATTLKVLLTKRSFSATLSLSQSLAMLDLKSEPFTTQLATLSFGAYSVTMNHVAEYGKARL